jgi:hypothetical protein
LGNPEKVENNLSQTWESKKYDNQVFPNMGSSNLLKILKE